MSNGSFQELIDSGYTIENVQNYSWFRDEDLNVPNPYIQITKQCRRKEIPYKFIDVKDDVLSFHDRLKDYGVSINFTFVYENDKGGLSRDNPLYEDFERGDFDNREVSILTIDIINYKKSTNNH